MTRMTIDNENEKRKEMNKPILNKLITKGDNQHNKKTFNCSKISNVVCGVFLQLGYIPPYKLKPMKAVIERVISCQSALAILLVRGGHFSSTVIHLSHLVQPLPSNDDKVHSTLPRSRQRIYSSSNGGQLTLEGRHAARCATDVSLDVSALYL